MIIQIHAHLKSKEDLILLFLHNFQFRLMHTAQTKDQLRPNSAITQDLKKLKPIYYAGLRGNGDGDILVLTLL